jgi:diacylglycerol kinase (ATP)
MSATIALIAQDSQKDNLLAFARLHQPVLARYRLIATAGTGDRLAAIGNLELHRYAAGSQGGDVQIGAEIVAGTVRAVIYWRDPAQQPDPTAELLMRLCDLHNVPFATNAGTASLILEGLARLRQAHLIFNPVAGQGNADEELALIQDLLGPHFNLKVHLTTPEIGAEELARLAIATQPDLVIASGGDGTVSAVAGCLIGTDVALGIIPRGTANAFGLALGISGPITPIRSACNVILQGHSKRVDAARCNGHPMVLLAGIGFEAETVEKASREFKDQWGALAYLMAGWNQLSEQELFSAKLLMNGETYAVDAGAITVANAAPPTSILAQGMGAVPYDDGLLDVTIATAETKFQAVTAMLSTFGATLMRQGTTNPNISHLRTDRIQIVTDPPQKVVLDGELIGTTPIEVECLPQALIVMVPGNS